MTDTTTAMAAIRPRSRPIPSSMRDRRGGEGAGQQLSFKADVDDA